MNSQLPSIKETLTDVRRAYRLIWGYQRRVMDMVTAIADRFETLEFYAWSPVRFERPVRLTTDPLKKWAWDAIPYYDVSFLYKIAGSSSSTLKVGEWMLEMHVMADSGLDPDDSQEPDASKFPDADSCTSTLTLVAWVCTKDIELSWFYGVWSELLWPDEDDLIVDQTDAPIQSIKRTFNLENLGNLESISAAVTGFKLLLAQQVDIRP